MSLNSPFSNGVQQNTTGDTLNSNIIKLLIFLLILVGIIARVSPLFDIEHRLFWQYMTEDGYLMQTIARNMAIGYGMSTAEGTIPTNGVQPLATLLFAGLHYLAEGSRQLGIVYITIFSTITALLSAWLLRCLALKLTENWSFPKNLALLLGALWFASPLIIKHSMNGLETGLYYLAIIGTLLYYFSLNLTDEKPMENKQRALFGLLLGLTFLARNDAVFFIAALLAAHVLIAEKPFLTSIKHRLLDAVTAGTISIVVGLPWLIYNQLNFGSIVPISGTAESHSAAIGENLMMIPANVLEAAMLYLPIPRSLEETLPILIFSLGILIALSIYFWKLFASKSLMGKRFFLTASLFSLCICGYYGLVFGAAWFVTRYLSALSPMLWFASFILAYILLNKTLKTRTANIAFVVFISAFLTISVISSYVTFSKGTDHMHKQVVDWTLANVDKTAWAGAVQTGTLSYFHDRTINLDGKTNPDALNAILSDGHVLTYVLEQTPIEYIVDWEGVCGWTSQTVGSRFSEKFKILIADKAINLCAMQRTN